MTLPDESDLDYIDTSSIGVRCACGELFFTRLPCLCDRCGSPKPYWKTLEGKTIKLSQMDTGHLANTIKMLAAKAEQYPGPEIEIALDLMYAELGTREQEMNQLSGIEAALRRSLTTPDVPE